MSTRPLTDPTRAPALHEAAVDALLTWQNPRLAATSFRANCRADHLAKRDGYFDGYIRPIQWHSAQVES
jgi:hypothetical protein